MAVDILKMRLFLKEYRHLYKHYLSTLFVTSFYIINIQKGLFAHGNLTCEILRYGNYLEF